jgi:hypothetical protein
VLLATFGLGSQSVHEDVGKEGEESGGLVDLLGMLVLFFGTRGWGFSISLESPWKGLSFCARVDVDNHACLLLITVARLFVCLLLIGVVVLVSFCFCVLCFIMCPVCHIVRLLLAFCATTTICLCVCLSVCLSYCMSSWQPALCVSLFRFVCLSVFLSM